MYEDVERGKHELDSTDVLDSFSSRESDLGIDEYILSFNEQHDVDFFRILVAVINL